MLSIKLARRDAHLFRAGAANQRNTEALHLALCAVARPGDVVAVESPTYYGLLQMLESQGLISLEIHAARVPGCRWKRWSSRYARNLG